MAKGWGDVETIFHSESTTWEQAGGKFNIALLCGPRTARRVPVAKEIRRADAIKVEMSCSWMACSRAKINPLKWIVPLSYILPREWRLWLDCRATDTAKRPEILSGCDDVEVSYGSDSGKIIRRQSKIRRFKSILQTKSISHNIWSVSVWLSFIRIG